MFIRSRVATAGHGVAMTQTFDYSSARIGPALPGKTSRNDSFQQRKKERVSMSLAVRTAQSVILSSLVGALAIGAPLAARADDPPPGWSGKGQLGYVMSRGNSDADSANAMLDVILLRNSWKHVLSLDGLYGRSAGITSAERVDARLQSDYTINAHVFAFGALSYQDDRFSGFQYQASGSAGIGYKFIDSSTTKLAAQLGVGYRSLRPEDLIKDDSGAVVERVPLETQSEAVGTAGIDFDHQFNASTKLTDKFLLESGSSNTSIKNDLALEVKMSKKLSLAAGFGVRDNTKPPAGLKRTDTVTTLNLVYAFSEAK
jgi:putative salt-induced outer membrane protein